MKKLLSVLTAAAIGLGGLVSVEASAQYRSSTTTVERHHVERNWHKKRAHRVCKTHWRNHHKVRRCRTVWR